MILSGEAIRRAVIAGDITIDPFDSSQVAPNSYDFRLGTRYKTYTSTILDASIPNPTEEREIGPQGITLTPGHVHLINTAEIIGSTKYVPIIRGRSSTGRLGLFTNITADLIDIGSINQLTLQLNAVVPITVYPGMLIGQVTFWLVDGNVRPYEGKYKGLQSPSESLSFRDFLGAS